MKPYFSAWGLVFMVAGIMTGCEGGSTEVVSPGDVTAQQEAEAKQEMVEVQNEEMLHQQEQGN